MPPDISGLRAPASLRKVLRSGLLPALFLFFSIHCAALGRPVEIQEESHREELDAAEVTVREVFLMGTVATIQVRGAEPSSRRKLAADLITSLERTEDELSTWRRSSELSRLNQAQIGAQFALSDSTCEMLKSVFDLSQRTGGAFDPAIGRLIEVWDLQGQGRIPGETELKPLLDRGGLKGFDFRRASCEVVRRVDTTIDAGAFGKGEALDRLDGIGSRFENSSWQVNLGGQVRVSVAPGHAPWIVELASPEDRESTVAEIVLSKGSIATSGSLLRDRWVEGRRIGHLLDPRTGIPAKYFGSVAVWHRSALQADALSTALFVMGPKDGLEWAEREAVAACYLFMEDGVLKVLSSSEFQKMFVKGRGFGER
ncbi:MAG: FAD:protein FMN transferase [Acidobacteriota bacterium]|nr:MAG: FAD:protein FMN transferase [Acidobacteriota bacterium]